MVVIKKTIIYVKIIRYYFIMNETINNLDFIKLIIEIIF